MTFDDSKHDTVRDVEEIITANESKDRLVNFILHHCPAPLGAENLYSLFEVYGYGYYGICDGYSWFTTKTDLLAYKGTTITDLARERGHRPLEEATEQELWQLVAMCKTYWLDKYEQWYEEANADLAEMRHENVELRMKLKEMEEKNGTVETDV